MLIVCSVPRLQAPIRDQRTTGLLWYRNKALLCVFQIDVGKMDVVELHAADLLELLLHAATCFQRVLKAFADDLLFVIAGRTDQLQEPGDGTTDSNRIPLIEVVAQLEPFVDRVSEVVLTHLAQVLGEVIDDQSRTGW